MENFKFEKGFKHSLILSTSLLFLYFGEYYWQQISEFAPPVSLTLILVLIIVIIIKLLMTASAIIRKKKNLNTFIILSTSIYCVTLLLVFVNPQKLHAESFQPEVLYRGCYEGTMNTATIKFRKNGNFEYRHVGFFGITTFTKGKWSLEGDTLNILFNGEPSEFVGTQLLVTRDRFIKIEGDLLLDNRWGFYRGYCKGLN